MFPVGFTLGGIFWVGTLLYCVIRDHEERHIWAWVILFLNVFGAAAYVLIRVLPALGFGEWIAGYGRRRREIARTEAEIMHLGERPHLLARLGLLLHESGRHADAEPLLRQACAQAEDLDYRYDLARILHAKGEPAEAIRLLRDVVARDRNFAYGDALRLLGRALFETGAHAEAEPIFEELVRTRPSPEARYHMASILEARGDVAGARAQIQRLKLEAKYAPPFTRRRDRRWLREARAVGRRVG